MKVIHFADIHLGYRQYQRQTPAGINQREADIAIAFRKTIDRTMTHPNLQYVAKQKYNLYKTFIFYFFLV